MKSTVTFVVSGTAACPTVVNAPVVWSTDNVTTVAGGTPGPGWIPPVPAYTSGSEGSALTTGQYSAAGGNGDPGTRARAPVPVSMDSTSRQLPTAPGSRPTIRNFPEASTAIVVTIVVADPPTVNGDPGTAVSMPEVASIEKAATSLRSL